MLSYLFVQLPVSLGVWLWSDEGWDLFSLGASLLQEGSCLRVTSKGMKKGTVYLAAAYFR
jgi:hypothetical protein